MVSENFPGLPPFPEDVPTAPLLRLSLTKLLKHDGEEFHRFCKACKDIGFFYLDLRDLEEGESILCDADKLFKLSEQLFALDAEEKKKYDLSEKKSYFGYKPLGAAIVDKKGNVDRNEFYNVCYIPERLYCSSNDHRSRGWTS
jgi:isopenicillin N synthase-like dioxygenase